MSTLRWKSLQGLTTHKERQNAVKLWWHSRTCPRAPKKGKFQMSEYSILMCTDPFQQNSHHYYPTFERKCGCGSHQTRTDFYRWDWEPSAEFSFQERKKELEEKVSVSISQGVSSINIESGSLPSSSVCRSGEGAHISNPDRSRVGCMGT